MSVPKIASVIRGSSILVQWALTRAIMLVLLPLGEWNQASGDFDHYFNSITGPKGSVTEYPEPAATVLRIPLLVVDTLGGYKAAALVMFIALDLAATWYLSRVNWSAARWWVWLSALSGPLMYLRFDLLVALVSLIAVGWGLSRPKATGALLGLGAAWKYWPAAIVVLLVRRGGGAKVLAAFGAVLGGATLLTASFFGWSRVLSPLTYQQRRGVECEAVIATPFLILRSLVPEKWSVAMSKFHAFEVYGPGVEQAKLVATVLTLLAGLIILALWYRIARLPRVDHRAFVWAACAATSLVIATNSVLSPQYLLWLVAPAAVLLTLLPRGPQKTRIAVLLVAALVLTHLEYPILGTHLFKGPVSGWGLVVTWVVAARNVLMVVLAALFVRGAWLATRSPGVEREAADLVEA